MRIGILSDLHANAEALNAVLEHARDEAIDTWWCLGDVVGYGADPDHCCDVVRQLGAPTVAGNHDWAACGLTSTRFFNRHAAAAAEWTARTMRRENLDWLAALPLVRHLEGVFLVHATPSEPAAWHYCMMAEDALTEMEVYTESLCVIGHSHHPGTFERDGDEIRYTRAEEISLRDGRQYLVNVGSVGQPRDGDPRAAYAILDTDAKRMRHVRIEYDIAGAQKKIIDAGLPHWLAQRLAEGD